MPGVIHADFKNKKRLRFCLGQRVFVRQLGFGVVVEINVSRLAPAIYVMQMESGQRVWAAESDLTEPK